MTKAMSKYNKLGITIKLKDGRVEEIDPIEGLLDEDGKLKVITRDGWGVSADTYEYNWEQIESTELYRMSKGYE